MKHALVLPTGGIISLNEYSANSAQGTGGLGLCQNADRKRVEEGDRIRLTSNNRGISCTVQMK